MRFLCFRITGKLLKKNCGEEEGKKKILKIFKCVDKKKVDEIQACTVGSLDVLRSLAESNEGRVTLLPKMCCLAHVTSECTSNKLSGLQCEDKSINPKEHIEQVLRALQEGLLNLFDV